MHALRRSLLASALALLALPAASPAANSTSNVSGLVGTELSLSVAAPSAMTLTHTPTSNNNQTSSVVTVTSTQPSWTLSIADNNSGSDAGHMLKTAGSGVATIGTPLSGALEWSSNGGSSFSNLGSSSATVGSGNLVDTKTVTYRQALTPTEDVSAADTFLLTVKYTVT